MTDQEPERTLAGWRPPDPALGPWRRASDNEYGIWQIDQTAPLPQVYSAPVLLELAAPIGVDLVRAGLARVMARHPALRAVFRARGDTLVTATVGAAAVRPAVTAVDVGTEEIGATVRSLALEPFYLSTGPVVRVTLLRVDDGRELLLLNVHHIVMDATSSGLLVRDLALACAELDGADAGPPEPSGQWTDEQYRVWLGSEEMSRRREDDRRYWSETFADSPRSASPRPDRPRPATLAFSGGAVHWRVPSATLDQVRRVGRELRVSAFTAYLAAFAAVLRNEGAGDDLIIGTPASLRDRPELAGVFGYLANMVAVRVRVGDTTTHRELVAACRAQVFDALRHKALPFNRVVDAVRPPRSADRPPLFQVAISLIDRQTEVPTDGPLQVARWHHVSLGAKYDLLLIVETSTTGTRTILEYDRGLFDEDRVAGMLRRFAAAVEAIADDPDRPLGGPAVPPEPDEAKATRANPPDDRSHGGAPATAGVVAAVRAAWTAVLDRDDFSDDQDFFSAGGYSLLVVRLATRLREALDVAVTVRELMRRPTVLGMATLLAGDRTATPPASAGPHRIASGEGDVELMARDASEALRDLTVRRRPADTRCRVALVTGATGFLGTQLVAALARRVDTVVCLVRARDAAHADARLEDALRHYRVELPATARVEVIAGDLADHELEDTEGRDALDRVDTVFHTAAAFNFTAGYASLRATNVEGFVRVARFCAAADTPRRLHHMSSFAAFSPAEGLPSITESDVPTRPNALVIGYAQTKWVVERLAVAARERGLPVTVHRIGRIGPDSQTGAMRQDDFFALVVLALVDLRCVPDDLGGAVDLMPVDHVARAIATLAWDPHLEAQDTYHLRLPSAVGWPQLVDHLRDLGHVIDAVPTAEWTARLRASGSPLAAVADLAAGALTVAPPQVATSLTAARLAAAGAPFADFDPAVLGAMLTHFRHEPQRPSRRADPLAP